MLPLWVCISNASSFLLLSNLPFFYIYPGHPFFHYNFYNEVYLFSLFACASSPKRKKRMRGTRVDEFVRVRVSAYATTAAPPRHSLLQFFFIFSRYFSSRVGVSTSTSSHLECTERDKRQRTHTSSALVPGNKTERERNSEENFAENVCVAEFTVEECGAGASSNRERETHFSTPSFLAFSFPISACFVPALSHVLHLVVVEGDQAI